MNKAFDLAYRLCVNQTRRMPQLRAYRFFRADKLMKILLRHPMIQEECLVMAKECTLSSGKLPSISMSRHNVVRINDRCDITPAVYSEREATKHTNRSFCQCCHDIASAVTPMSVLSRSSILPITYIAWL